MNYNHDEATLYYANLMTSGRSVRIPTHLLLDNANTADELMAALCSDTEKTYKTKASQIRNELWDNHGVMISAEESEELEYSVTHYGVLHTMIAEAISGNGYEAFYKVFHNFYDDTLSPSETIADKLLAKEVRSGKIVPIRKILLRYIYEDIRSKN